VIHTFAALELSIGRADVFSEFRALDEPFVLGDVEENGRSATVLCQNERAAGLLYLAQELGGVRPELGKRLDVTRKLGSASHGRPRDA
jgi:hypothetical protein